MSNYNANLKNADGVIILFYNGKYVVEISSLK
jgi:hypothetical protein